MSITSQSLQDDDGIGERFHLFFIDPRQLSLYYEATSHLAPEPNFLCDHLGPFCATIRLPHCQIHQIYQLALSRDTQSAPKGENWLRTVMAAFCSFPELVG
jgi:hypothetical protein